MSFSSVTFRVPASTSNLGPGFDTLGLALQLYNEVTVSRGDGREGVPAMAEEAAALFFESTADRGVKSFPFSLKICGDIPISRGLGSSVSVRLGLLLGLAELVAQAEGVEIAREEILQMVIVLEGHPDNAVASCLGGFAVCSRKGFTRVDVDKKLCFIALIPELELSTERARELLPAQVSFAEAVANLQNTARIATLFAQRDYASLAGLFEDHLHQPFRQILIPGFEAIVQAAEAADALGCFLSGAGSTLLALSLLQEGAIAAAMESAASAHGLKARTLLLRADNEGAQKLGTDA